MADYALSSFNGTFSIFQSDTRWIVPEGVDCANTGSTFVIYGDSQYTGTEILVAGSVTAAAANAIEVLADSTSVTVAKSGTVHGVDAIHLNGTNQTAWNQGTVTSTNIGIRYETVNAEIKNDGKIESDFICIGGLIGGATIENNGRLVGQHGIYIAGSDNEIILGTKSRILAEDMGIWAEGNADFSLVNRGLITGDIQADGGVTNITNLGTLKGDARLGGGDDVINLSKGNFEGTVYGGAGNDIFVLRTARTLIVENALEGTDTIQSSASISLESNIFRSQEIENVTLTGKAETAATGNELDNGLTGNKASNTLNGGAGVDTLSGNKGNDFLKGGSDADFFMFRGGDGRDAILDLKENDTVRIADWTGMNDFLDVLDHAKNVGKDVVISSGNDALVIKGLHKADLDQTSFDFL